MNHQLIPPQHLMGAVGPGDYLKFQAVATEFLGYFQKFADLKPSESVLDVGCGVGRIALALTEYLDSQGSYQGFDILKEGIKWCQKNISPLYPNFQFEFANIYSKNYNPQGIIKASEYQFNYADESFDFVYLTSVFTHMVPADLENYLREISRVLKPSGRCLITFCLLTEESLKLVDAKLSKFDFKYDFGFYRLMDLDIPEIGVAYQEDFILSLYEKSGLKLIQPIQYGKWCGRTEFLSGQDIIIAQK